MALLTVHLRLVSPYGENDVVRPANGRVDFTPVGHGKYDESLRTIERVTSQIIDGIMTPVELTPAVWSVVVTPNKGVPWPEMVFHLEEGMEEPINLPDLLPELVLNGKEYAKGDPGPGITGGYANEDGTVVLTLENGGTIGPITLPSGPQGETGASIVDARDNGDGTLSFILSNDEETEPVVIPRGPAGLGIESVSNPDENSVVTITYTDGTTSTVQAIKGDTGAAGHTPELSWEGTSLSIDGVTGPDLKGETGDVSTTPGPPNTLTIGTVTAGSPPSATISGTAPNQTLSLTLPQGPAGVKGDPGNLGTTLIYGTGRPDIPATMTTETAASVADASSGAEFISTDGPQGAWKWQKLGTKWEVTLGDTGWIDITSTIENFSTKAKYTIIGTIVMKRKGSDVIIKPGAEHFQVTPADTFISIPLPSGFQAFGWSPVLCFDRTTAYGLKAETTRVRAASGPLSPWANRIAHIAPLTTTDSWPATLTVPAP